MIASGTIAAVRVGRSAPLPGAGRRGADLVTAYFKSPVDGPVAIRPLGLDGDTQVNRRWHGGLEKAVYGYPASGYDGWRAEFAERAEQFVPGAMGENLVILGLDETSVCIGDTIRAGTALLQVAQHREPCATFTAVHGTAKLARAMSRSARCGWYYRVLEPGIVAAGDSHNVVERHNSGWTVARFVHVIGGKAEAAGALAELVTLPGLTPAWQAHAANALATQQARLL
ncbi:MOSC domain-containing protein [Sandarakinorhabdus sp. DWP1-3-1]|uniref:MOSC domain-containing protein n=1 Tax=Sandarakinorhabdus sp. DWP1-3-1 TaxID=2804627 RepID=UPI003CE9AD31